MILCLFAFCFASAAKKSLAVLPCIGDLDPNGLERLRDKVEEIARDVLPTADFRLIPYKNVKEDIGDEALFDACKEGGSCFGDLAGKANADYGAWCTVKKYEGKWLLKFELYSVGDKNILYKKEYDSYNPKNSNDLIEIIKKEVPVALKTTLKISKKFSPNIAEGISGVQTTGGDYELDGGKRYVVNLSTEPAGAVLSFNGVPNSRCSKTPCKIELSEGNVRIIANLEQYEIADTTVFIKQNGQSIAIKLKPNFGVLEIKPAYLEGIGSDKPWDLSINDKLYSLLYSLGEINLSPNKYKVKLGHECYEDIIFDAGINKGKREVFDMAGKIKLKKGGLVLSAERNGEPVIDPVFVNGKRVGETPFSGSVPVCAKIEIGESREKVYVKLKPNEKVTYKHESTESQSTYEGWINEVGQVKEQDNTKNEYQTDRTDNYSKSSIFDDANIADANPSRFDKIKFGIGGALEIGGLWDENKISVVKNADSTSTLSTISGSSLGIVTSIPIASTDDGGFRLTFNPEFYFVYRQIIDTTTSNYRIVEDNGCLPYCDMEVKEHLEISEYALNIPLIIMLSCDDGKNELFSRMYLEAGVYLDIPLKTKANGVLEFYIYNEEDMTYGDFSEEIHIDREKYNFGGILGIGFQFGGLSLGFRGNIGMTHYFGLTYNNRRNTGGTPFTVSLIARYLF